MEKLEEIAKNTFKNTGFFHNVNIDSYPDKIRGFLDGVGQDKYAETAKGAYQTGGDMCWSWFSNILKGVGGGLGR